MEQMVLNATVRKCDKKLEFISCCGEIEDYTGAFYHWMK